MSFSRAERAVVTDWWITVDRTLLALILVLAVAGLAASFAASPYIAQKLKLEPFYFVKRHALGMMAALAIVFIVSLATPQQVKRLALIMFGVGLALMALALLQGMERNGAVRWLNIGGVLLQPSEFVKPGFVVLSAWLFSESIKRQDMPALELAGLMLVAFVALLVLQPDMGQTLIVAAVWCALFFLSGYSLRFAPIFLALAAGGLLAAYFTMPHVMSRINRFAGGGTESLQTVLAMNAFRDAGWLGHGFGEGFAKGRLPDAHNDFVFAAIAEEMGVAACLFLVAIYAFIVWKALTAAFRERDAFIRLAAVGLVMLFGLQALVNMAVNLNLIPAKGVTLPFISYGRSSLLATAVTLGMIVALTRRSVFKYSAQVLPPWVSR
ncbi:FtsW/RodA/SpoVE family cell cycle protein [Rhodomicrobium sp. Az07]|uniref:FtsW/RodA/SpoVE family cell cycle protein n=1 Tax=Rhodomicrobium sp. Az07 TaxID=2839034 RepID=UPI001BE8F4F6|nr:FtsW/RodA/SpoVE family cell cycle protein [Rhodomicrobium sp. Az07]MBT3071725.1 FtsW/RodA/SpoVE family cell cycle protein [Rhodomicrobium sp. Az07]